MGEQVEIRVRGVDELAAGMHTLAGRIDDAAPRELKAAADQTAGRVQASLPRRTGRLAASVSSDTISRGASVSMGDGVPYARYVEFGGRGFPHSVSGNYLYPAAQAAEPLVVAAAERAANREIGAMDWPSP
jgi:Bacteriophage HK97-gp10, putative tail-component